MNGPTEHSRFDEQITKDWPAIRMEHGPAKRIDHSDALRDAVHKFQKRSQFCSVLEMSDLQEQWFLSDRLANRGRYRATLLGIHVNAAFFRADIRARQIS